MILIPLASVWLFGFIVAFALARSASKRVPEAVAETVTYDLDKAA